MKYYYWRERAWRKEKAPYLIKTKKNYDYYVCYFSLKLIKKDPKLEQICLGLNYRRPYTTLNVLAPSDEQSLSYIIDELSDIGVYLKFMEERKEL